MHVMGRCYEFGPLIGEGCEHTMVVAAEGGHCECPSCGVTCPGRFAGCAAVVAKPGYVPVLAPKVAPTPSALAPTTTAVVVDHIDTVDTRLPNGSALANGSAPSEVQRLAEELRAALATRDGQLLETLRRLEDAYTELATEVAALRTDQDKLRELLEAQPEEPAKPSDAAERSLASMRGLFGKLSKEA